MTTRAAVLGDQLRRGVGVVAGDVERPERRLALGHDRPDARRGVAVDLGDVVVAEVLSAVDERPAEHGGVELDGLGQVGHGQVGPARGACGPGGVADGHVMLLSGLSGTSLPPTPDSLRAGLGSGYRLADARPARRTRHRHRGRHPAAVLGRPGAPAVPAARRRRHHRAVGARHRRGAHVRRGDPGRRASRGHQLRLGRLPRRGRRAARAGAGDRRGDHHPRRAGVLRAADAGRGGAAGHRRGARAGAVLRQDGPQGAGREGPRRRSDLPQPRVPRRHARRPRVDQRHLRRRDEDELRALPALLDLPVGGARQAVGQREGARVQRQGRGPAVPRPPQPSP